MRLEKQLILKVFFALAGISFLVLPIILNAQTTDIGVSSEVEEQLGLPNDLPSSFTNIVKWLLLSLGLIGVIMIIYAGVLWLTAAGNEERITTAKKTITTVIIGLAVILLAWAIVTFVIDGLVYGSGEEESFLRLA